MPQCCVVGGCQRMYEKDSKLGFFRFPTRDRSQRQAWVSFVKDTKKNFNPSFSSRICSKHFSPECFDISTRLKREFGIKTGVRLRAGAVPTLKAPSEKAQIKQLLMTSGRHQADVGGASSPLVRYPYRPPHCPAGPGTPPPHPCPEWERTAVEKQEARVVNEASDGEEPFDCADDSADCSGSEKTVSAPGSPNFLWSQLSPAKERTAELTQRLSIQLDVVKINIKPSRPRKGHSVHSKRTQTNPGRFAKTQAVQTGKLDPQLLISRPTQCEVVKLPKLKKLAPLKKQQSTPREISLEKASKEEEEEDVSE